MLVYVKRVMHAEGVARMIHCMVLTLVYALNSRYVGYPSSLRDRKLHFLLVDLRGGAGNSHFSPFGNKKEWWASFAAQSHREVTASRWNQVRVSPPQDRPAWGGPETGSSTSNREGQMGEMGSCLRSLWEDGTVLPHKHQNYSLCCPPPPPLS